MSQSSKWVHFGLGKTGDVEKVVIRWPGGEMETVRGIETGGHYRIVQGARKAAAESTPDSGPPTHWMLDFPAARPIN